MRQLPYLTGTLGDGLEVKPLTHNNIAHMLEDSCNLPMKLDLALTADVIYRLSAIKSLKLEAMGTTCGIASCCVAEFGSLGLHLGLRFWSYRHAWGHV